MYRKFKKAAAVILASAMLMQSGVQGMAEETAAQAAETQTEAATEAQTQAPQTEAQTEAQTPAATEAQTQAPQTETQAATEAQTQTPTEAQMQTETQAATEAQTQSASEKETEKKTEKETEKETEKKTEKETERSGRKNDGKKMKSSDLTSSLQAALPYLFAAGSVKGSEELLKDQEIAENGSIVSGLAGFSKELANAVSSADVEVINLYADADGTLDTAQLDEKYGNHVIDVTKKYYVVNVIADHADQALSFSGYAMTLSGATVTYEDEAQPGDILYNFAALDGDEYTGYTGKLTLANGSGLQGAYLAPEADVLVQSDLAGAVYAKNVEVADSVEELLQIVFVKGRQPEETEAVESEGGAEETEAAESEDGAKETNLTDSGENESGQSDTEEKKGVSVYTSDMTEPEESESVSEMQTAEPEESETASEIEVVTAEEDETQSTEPAETESTAGEEALSGEEELIDLDSYMAEGEWITYADDRVALNVKLVKGDAPAEKGTVAVHAAVMVLNADGSVKYRVGDVVSSASVVSGTASVGANLTKGGRYYLELSGLPDGCYGVQRLYFTVGEDGRPVFAAGSASLANDTLTITLYDEEQAAASASGTALLTVTDKDGNSLGGSVFVLKDSEKKVIKDVQSGSPLHYIRYDGTPVLLTGLAAGTYYLSQISAAEGYAVAADKEFEIAADATEPVSVEITNEKASGTNTLTVAAQAYGNDQLLTAEADQKTSYYAALFTNRSDASSRVSAVRQLTFSKDAQTSAAVSFAGLAAGTYYVMATDEFGEIVGDVSWQAVDAQGADLSAAGVAFAGTGETKNAGLHYKFVVNDTQNTYPDGDFSYTAAIRLTKKLLDYDGSELMGQSSDVFSVDLYQDADRTQKVTSSSIVFDMNGKASLEQNYSMKMTVGRADYYLSEVHTEKTPYTVSYLPNSDGRLTVTCGTSAIAAEIENRLNDTTVHLRIIDGSTGKHISGVTMVVKDENGKIVYNNGKAVAFKSGSKDKVLANALEAGRTYYLSQVSAPSGYAPSADVAFTVVRGEVSEAEMVASAAVTTDHTITVTKQVYSGAHQVYAQDNTSGTNAAKGRYTFYAALFADKAHTQKVSDVKKITVKGLSGSAVFKNLEANTDYYVAETNAYGEPLTSTETRTIKYADGGLVTTSSKSRSTVIQNVYSSLPSGYRYTARITLTKNVTKASGEAASVNETFYAGLFRKSDYSDKPTIIKLELQNASSTYTSRRILLPNSGETTYYIAEVNADGSRISEDSFGYSISVSSPTLKVSSGDDASVTITNKEKSSKVTLYLTKKVYQGTAQKAVNETFYAGLFKDEKFTQLYTKPIPMNMNGKSELTLKLSLNLGSASNANIYVAEVDQNGKVIKNEASFGYEIRLVNSTAAFTQEKREVQTILLNSVYGTVSQDDWNQILSSDGNDIGGGGGISGNGEVGEAAQTGDDTPIALYAAVMAAALLVIVIILIFRKKRKK